MFLFIATPQRGGRQWDRVIDIGHRQNWRARCVHVWNIMCEYDSYAVNANQYNDDLGIYDLCKSDDGWTIVHCVISSSGLEIRILLYFSDFRNIYICRQYHGCLSRRNSAIGGMKLAVAEWKIKHSARFR